MTVGTSLALEPVQAGERVALVDILRGFALFGILLVNFSGTSGPHVPWLDRSVDDLLEWLVSDSFRPLFSFLFGLGFAIQLSRSRERGTGIVPVYIRRMLVLFIIGTIHAVLIWQGDILKNYAVGGLLLIPIHRLPVRGVLLAGLLVLGYTFESGRLSRMVAEWTNTVGSQQTRELNELERNDQLHVSSNIRLRAESRGSWKENVAARWELYGQWVPTPSTLMTSLDPEVLFMFVIGLYVGRRRFLQEARSHTRGFAIVALAGAIAAIAGNILLKTYPGASGEAETAIGMAANLGVTAFFVAAITLLVTRGARAPRALAVFAPAGRMGLTNYLMQSLVMTSLFYSYMLHLPSPGGAARVLLNSLFFFLLQVPLSMWWLARFQYGPAEWVWRSLTYGRAQPMLRQPLVPALAPVPR